MNLADIFWIMQVTMISRGLHKTKTGITFTLKVHAPRLRARFFTGTDVILSIVMQ